MIVEIPILHHATRNLPHYFINYNFGAPMPVVQGRGYVIKYPVPIDNLNAYPNASGSGTIFYIPKGIPCFVDMELWDRGKKIPETNKMGWWSGYLMPPKGAGVPTSMTLFQGVIPRGADYYNGITDIRDELGSFEGTTLLSFSTEMSELIPIETIEFNSSRRIFINKVINGLSD